MAVEDNGSLQSLVQLAVALNLTFAALLAIFEQSFSKQIGILTSLKVRIDALSENLSKNSDDKTKTIRRELYQLQVESFKLLERASSIGELSRQKRNHLYSQAALVGAAVSFGLLLCFSFVPNLPQSGWTQVLALLVFGPVVAFIVAPLINDRPELRRIRHEYDAIDERFANIRLRAQQVSVQSTSL